MIGYTTKGYELMQTNEEVCAQEPPEGWPEGENYAKYAPPSALSELLYGLVDTYIEKLAAATLTVDEQTTAATIIGAHVRKLRNTLAALMK